MQPFLGQIQPYGFGFAPKNWALCNGQIIAISQNTALFSLLGTYYGGNGQTNFALPNLQSRVPMHFGTAPSGAGYDLGEMAGEETLPLTSGQMPLHNHAFVGTSANGNTTAADPGQLLATVFSASSPDNFYGPDTTLQPLNPGSILPYGNGLPHNNIQPYLTINWCIALRGLFPSRN